MLFSQLRYTSTQWLWQNKASQMQKLSNADEFTNQAQCAKRKQNIATGSLARRLSPDTSHRQLAAMVQTYVPSATESHDSSFGSKHVRGPSQAIGRGSHKNIAKQTSDRKSQTNGLRVSTPSCSSFRKPPVSGDSWNLCLLNQFLDIPSFKMETPESIQNELQQGELTPWAYRTLICTSSYIRDTENTSDSRPNGWYTSFVLILLD